MIPRRLLNDMKIKCALPREKPFRMFDGGGLYLEVAPAGGKWWRFKYRIDKKEKRISLGVYPEVSLEEAREKCSEARKALKITKKFYKDMFELTKKIEKLNSLIEHSTNDIKSR